FFAQAGFPCPALRNPSDHFLRGINSDFDKVKATLKGSMKLRIHWPINVKKGNLELSMSTIELLSILMLQNRKWMTYPK
ncbi:hypothetical protein S83_001816, partial [Arachis hypogaea]